jgi:hypothetical protein
MLWMSCFVLVQARSSSGGTTGYSTLYAFTTVIAPISLSGIVLELEKHSWPLFLSLAAVK